MELLVAGRVQEHAVVCFVTASMCSPDDVMAVPPRHLGDLLMAEWAEPVLFLPEAS